YEDEPQTDEPRPRRRRRPSTSQAREMVSGPATGLLVTGILGIVTQVCGLAGNVMIASGALPAGPQFQGGAQQQQQQQMMNMSSGVIGIVMGFVGLVLSVVIIMGAQRMKRLESYGFVMTSAILAAIPCISPCCLVGLPVGIWALVVLNKPEVNSAFH